ncbi:DoxX family protein [Nocardia sp. NBC_00565]|uniref:DoxX family protein n=1 Tax=Nocardia sp. NBC_00565 TaxID=2975993 RepID=UPI002E806A91|nr:DoxX family protein [Nocardia sp. NBC_00565]WUC05977.1 DoxX family protein [Nocardia sp. NBC_00565]
MNIALWIGQVLLAVVFTTSGIAKSTQSKEKLVAMGQTGVAVFPQPVVRLTAYSELLGVIGIIVPWWTGIAPVLTPLAAVGFAVVMIGAIAAHIRLREPRNIAITTTVLIIAVFVAIGRFAGL